MEYEIVGIAATLFVLLSFLMKKVETIRLVNIIGAALFVIYGYLIGSLSTWLLNGALIIIHSVYLYNAKRKESEETT